MLRIYTALVLWNLVVLLGAATCGALVLVGALDPHVHHLAGLFAAVFGCLVHSLLVIHFIGSMKWIQQTSPTAGLEEAESRRLRRIWIKGRMFPVLILTMLLTVAAAMAGGGASAGGLLTVLHVALAVSLFPANLWALLLARRGIVENHERMQQVGALAEGRVAAGLVREEAAEALLPESGRAGGKVFLFLGVNAWVVWVYVRFVLRHRDTPLWPFAAASALCLVVGLALLRTRWGRSGERGYAAAEEEAGAPTT